jgi:hypothetical protein
MTPNGGLPATGPDRVRAVHAGILLAEMVPAVAILALAVTPRHRPGAAGLQALQAMVAHATNHAGRLG